MRDAAAFRPGILPVLLFALLWAAAPPAASAPLDFVIIQPGAPGSAAEAAPVMQAFAAYLRRKTGSPAEPAGRYFNRMDEARRFLRTERPAWGIVSLGVFVSGLEGPPMHPIASTRPAGLDRDRWTLLAAVDGPDRWRDLRGRIEGSVLFAAPDYAARRLFGEPAEELPFGLAGTRRPLRAARKAASGRIAGVVLNAVQYETLKALPLHARLKPLARTEALPTSPVVWFGPPGAEAERLAGVLRTMAADPAAASLLEMLRTDGFGPPDEALRVAGDRGGAGP